MNLKYRQVLGKKAHVCSTWQLGWLEGWDHSKTYLLTCLAADASHQLGHLMGLWEEPYMCPLYVAYLEHGSTYI